MSRAARTALALLPLLTGCAALGPNLTGGWSGDCTTYTPTGDVVYALDLNLDDEGGEVSGDGEADIDDPLLGEFFVELGVEGERKNSGAALELRGKEQGRLDLEGELTEQTFAGTCLVGEDWGSFELKRRWWRAGPARRPLAAALAPPASGPRSAPRWSAPRSRGSSPSRGRRTRACCSSRRSAPRPRSSSRASAS